MSTSLGLNNRLSKPQENGSAIARSGFDQLTCYLQVLNEENFVAVLVVDQLVHHLLGKQGAEAPGSHALSFA
jgi:hypothetical protein